MSDTILEVRQLTGPAHAPAIFDVSIACERGRLTVVLGPIHAGKSLVMRHVVGLEIAARGTIAIDGETFSACGESDVVLRRMRTRIGVVFQGAALISRLNARENVELPLLEHTNATAEEAGDAAAALLAEVGLELDGETEPRRLDRATQRRVALARALALRPPVILLDEPSQGLDAHAAAELDQTLAELQAANGFGTVIFSHDVRYAFGRADKVYVMANGRIIESGTCEEVRASDNEVVHRLLNRRGAA